MAKIIVLGAMKGGVGKSASTLHGIFIEQIREESISGRF